jgi:hypothetical protein
MGLVIFLRDIIDECSFDAFVANSSGKCSDSQILSVVLTCHFEQRIV